MAPPIEGIEIKNINQANLLIGDLDKKEKTLLIEALNTKNTLNNKEKEEIVKNDYIVIDDRLENRRKEANTALEGVCDLMEEVGGNKLDGVILKLGKFIYSKKDTKDFVVENLMLIDNKIKVYLSNGNYTRKGTNLLIREIEVLAEVNVKRNKQILERQASKKEKRGTIYSSSNVFTGDKKPIPVDGQARKGIKR